MKSITVNLDRLESHLWDAANILRRPVDPIHVKTHVFPLLFFKRISDVHDDEYAAALVEPNGDDECAKFPRNYRFQIPMIAIGTTCAPSPIARGVESESDK